MQYEKKENHPMNTSTKAIKSVILPLLFIFPLMGIMACSSDTTNQAFDRLGETIADIPENVETASPMIQDDLENIWADVSGQMEVYAAEIGLEEPSHPLADAQDARDKLISGTSFRDVVANASNEVTTEDLTGIHADELAGLNGILPFDIDITKCGETLAEVLNSLDIGQVSSILETEQGFHLIKLIDRDGARVRIGHLVFEIDPQLEEEPTVADQPEGMDEAIAKLNDVLAENW